MITQDEAIALAREVYEDAFKDGIYLDVFDKDDITALCNLVRKQTLMEAADILFLDQDKHENPCTTLRRMAKGE